MLFLSSMNDVILQMISFLLANVFPSKRNMADALGISYRTLLNVCAGRGSTKNINEVTSAILRYCIQYHISLEPALQQQ